MYHSIDVHDDDLPLFAILVLRPPAPDSMAAGNPRFSSTARTAGGTAAFGLTKWSRSIACHAAAAAHTSPAAAAATAASAVAAQSARAAVAAVEAAPATAGPKTGWPAEGVPAARPRAAGERDAADTATPTMAGVESLMATAPKAMATAATLAYRSADEMAVAEPLVAARRVSQSPRALAAAATEYAILLAAARGGERPKHRRWQLGVRRSGYAE